MSLFTAVKIAVQCILHGLVHINCEVFVGRVDKIFSVFDRMVSHPVNNENKTCQYRIFLKRKKLKRNKEVKILSLNNCI